MEQMRMRDIIDLKRLPKENPDIYLDPDRKHPDQIHQDIVRTLQREPDGLTDEELQIMYSDPEHDLKLAKDPLSARKIEAEIAKIDAEAARARVQSSGE